MKLPAANLKDTPFANVKFTFVLVTPELAAEWLKRNRKNRRLKERALEKYIMDMRNAAWLTTSECLTFDEDGNLTDGQHRLEGIVRAKVPVLMVVSTGWPVSQGKKKTMDALNMGANRTLADQLHLQHDIPTKEAGNVVKLCNSLAAAAFGLSRVKASTTNTILAVFALYKTEINWWLQNPITTHGIKQATVAACLIMGRACWADKTQDALNRLQTGENLTRENALLHLRNWLMSDGSREDCNLVRNVTLHHLAAFVDGKAVPQVIVNSNAAYIRLMKLHKVRMEKICAIYNQPLPEFLRAESEKPASTKKVGALDPEAVKIGGTLSATFTSTDLIARTDGQAGQWLLVWMNRKWIESAGVNQYRKTDKFGNV